MAVVTAHLQRVVALPPNVEARVDIDALGASSHATTIRVSVPQWRVGSFLIPLAPYGLRFLLFSLKLLPQAIIFDDPSTDENPSPV
jgi:hypothetical protein